MYSSGTVSWPCTNDLYDDVHDDIHVFINRIYLPVTLRHHSQRIKMMFLKGK